MSGSSLSDLWMKSEPLLFLLFFEYLCVMCEPDLLFLFLESLEVESDARVIFSLYRLVGRASLNGTSIVIESLESVIAPDQFHCLVSLI